MRTIHNGQYITYRPLSQLVKHEQRLNKQRMWQSFTMHILTLLVGIMMGMAWHMAQMTPSVRSPNEHPYDIAIDFTEYIPQYAKEITDYRNRYAR